MRVDGVVVAWYGICFYAVVIGITTLPAISPGEPVCNLGKLPNGTKPSAFRNSRREEDGLEERVSKELASNVMFVEHRKNLTSALG